jgi:hypothetical protein
MIEKMREDVGEHHQPTGEPDLPNADAAQVLAMPAATPTPGVLTPVIAGACTEMRRPFSASTTR